MEWTHCLGPFPSWGHFSSAWFWTFRSWKSDHTPLWVWTLTLHWGYSFAMVHRQSDLPLRLHLKLTPTLNPGFGVDFLNLFYSWLSQAISSFRTLFPLPSSLTLDFGMVCLPAHYFGPDSVFPPLGHLSKTVYSSSKPWSEASFPMFLAFVFLPKLFIFIYLFVHLFTFCLLSAECNFHRSRDFYLLVHHSNHNV